MFTEPHVDVEEEVLLRPEQAAEGLSHDACAAIFAGGLGRVASVELVRLAAPRLERLLESGKRTRLRRIGEAQPYRHRLAGTDLEEVVSGGLGADLRRVDGVGLAVHDERVERVLDVRVGVRCVEESLGVRLVLGEQQPRRSIAVEPSIAQVPSATPSRRSRRWRLSPPRGGASPSPATSSTCCGTTGLATDESLRSLDRGSRR